MRSVLGRVRARATSIVMGWSPLTRRQAPALALILALYFAHYAVWCLITPFYIEDSGISFAFARNIATGLGAVPFAGAERVEAYSNATWTFLLAALYVVRVDPFFAAKVLGGLFGSITLLLAWAIGHEARGAAPEPDRDALRDDTPVGQSPVPEWAPLIGPALLAASTQFTLWNASGLENSLFNVLLAWGIWRLSVEIRTGSEPGAARRLPWSAVAFCLLTMTRPDGLGYAAVAVFARVLGTLRTGQWTAAVVWALTLAAPWGAYNAVRYEYFAWWFPNTYYAKEKADTVNLLGWTTGGWKQLKDWAVFYGVVFATPAVVLALLPPRAVRWRRALAATLLVLFAVATLWDGRLGGAVTSHLPPAAGSWWATHVARSWNAGVVVFLTAASVVLGLLTLRGRGWVARGLLWASFAVGAFFWVWSTGDWMKGFRWGSLVSVPVFTLIGLGLGALGRGLPDSGAPLLAWVLQRTPTTRRGWTLTGLGLSCLVAAVHLGWVAGHGGVPGGLFTGSTWFRMGAAVVVHVPTRTSLGVFLAIPVATLLGFGIGHLRQRLPEGANRMHGPSAAATLAVLGAVALVTPNTWKGYEFAKAPETSVNDVHRRANYMGTVAEKLDVDDVTLLDVDMGAHMYFTDWHIADMAGLIDVPMARHKYQKSFIDDYVFSEVRPTFAHVHGSWANTTKIPKNPKWKQQYLEITGYPSGARGYHVGNHIRKDLVARTDYVGPADTQVDFGGGVTMAGWSMPAPEIAPGGKLYLRTWWIATTRTVGFRVLVFLKDKAGHLHSAEVAPAFDWYRPERWGADEYVVGNWYIPVPPSLPAGDYDLGVVLIDNADGQVLPWLGAAEGATRFLPGEWVQPGAVHLVSAEAATAKADEKLGNALQIASQGGCEAARERFKDARRHIARNTAWRDAHEPELEAAVVACFVQRAADAPTPEGSAMAIAAALRVDPTDTAALAAGRPVAEALIAQGRTALDDGDAQAAYTALLAAVRADPRRSDARVDLERARDLKLGISGKEPEKSAPEKAAPARPLSPVERIQDDLDEAAGREPAEAAGGGE